MSQYLAIHAARPEPHLLSVVVESLQKGAVIAYPTDSGYALGCLMGLIKPLERICKIRQLDPRHSFTLICRNLTEVSKYAKLDNTAHRLLKRCTPGGYTFILPTAAEMPRLFKEKRKTVGVRIPEHAIALALVARLGEPLLSTTLILPGQKAPLIYPEDVGEALRHQVDIVIDGGYCGFEPTTVVDLTEPTPHLLRQGSGDISLLGI